MTLALSIADTLSLYTEIDTQTGSPTALARSVLIHRPKETPKTLYLIDNLTFELFLSVTRDVSTRELKRHMINSYCFTHFNSSTAQDNRPVKGAVADEATNIMIESSLVALLQQNDEYNDSQFEQFSTALTNERQRQRATYYDEDGEEENVVDQGGEEEEEAEEDSLPVSKLFTGFDTPLHMPNASKANRPNENQYRLVFRNHYMVSYFVKKFENPVKLRCLDGSYQSFYIDVLGYEKYNTALRAIDKRFTGQPREYIDGQLRVFKDKNDTVLMRLPLIQRITDGLLHPSCCRGERNTTRQSTPNRLENVFNAVSTPYRSRTASYQTLYVHLGDTTLNDYTFNLVDYSRRQMVEKTVATNPKKRSLNEKPIKNQPGVSNFFKKARIDHTSDTAVASDK